MFDVSAESANLWFDTSNLVLLVGAVLVAVGTYGAMKFSGIKEKFADERISVNETETKRAVAESDKANAALGVAQADIAKANAQIADAHARTKEAELKLEELRKKVSQRHLDGDRFVELLKGQPKLPVEILFPRDDGEAFQLALEIRDWLRRVNWEASEPAPMAPANISDLALLPTSMAVGGQPQGVSLVTHSLSETESNDLMNAVLNRPVSKITAYIALYRALSVSLGALGGSGGHRSAPIEGILRVVVGSKPQ
jgi:hypothetical protein